MLQTCRFLRIVSTSWQHVSMVSTHSPDVSILATDFDMLARRVDGIDVFC